MWHSEITCQQYIFELIKDTGNDALLELDKIFSILIKASFREV